MTACGTNFLTVPFDSPFEFSVTRRNTYGASIVRPEASALTGSSAVKVVPSSHGSLVASSNSLAL